MNYLISVVNPGAMDRVCEIAAALDLPQCLGVQAGRVRDEHHIIVCRGGGQFGVLGVQQLRRAGAQRAGQVTAQSIGLQGPAAVGAKVGKVFQMTRPDGAKPHEQRGDGTHRCPPIA